MITKEQAIALGESWGNAEVHAGACTRKVGPRGGETIQQERWRVNGRCQVWKTQPGRFRLPIKYGLRGYGEVTERNADIFHLAEDCPLNK